VNYSFASSYLSRQKSPGSEIPDPPSENLGYIVVIPALCEPDLINTLRSLRKCTRPARDIEVIVVINASENASKEIIDCNGNMFDAVVDWIRKSGDKTLKFYILNETLPSRDAGAGLARKTGMDEALRRFSSIGKNNGYILSLDADSTCDENYFTAIEETILKKPLTKGFEIYFEHPLTGSGYTENVYQAITQYEVHLRYVKLFLKLTGFPHAHHTIGSCFGVRADIYAAQGGMNKRKGGEDFYFLHKVIPLGNFEEITGTRVIPSPRDSFRVPFGTGPVIRKLIETGEELTTYHPETFRILKAFITLIPLFYKADKNKILSLVDPLSENIRVFLEDHEYLAAIVEVNNNSGSYEAFINRFFRWFDAFRIIKYLNYSAMHFIPKQPVRLAAIELLKDMEVKVPEKQGLPELLYVLRKIEKGD